MDPTSIGIIITSMALSAVLLLLFKLNFFSLADSQPIAARMGAIKSANNAPKSTLANGKPSASNGATRSANKSNCVKQVHFAETVSTRTLNEPTRNNKHNNHSTATSKNHQGAVKNSRKNKASANTYPNQSQDHYEFNKENNNSPKLSKIIQHDVAMTTPLAALDREPNAIELYNHELESSIPMEVCNSSKTGALNRQKLPPTERKSTRRRQNSDQVSYSSEKLFAMIAASYLSNDEVQLAVETLLNKLDSAEPEWRRPKSDPMQRLKNQLRDTENSLSTEAQNHKQTRARLNELKIELQTEKSSRNSSNDELAKLKKKLSGASVTLEKAQHELLAQHESIQGQIGNNNSMLIGELERENAQLQTLLANKTGVRSDEVTKLHSELEDRESKLNHYELANQNLTNDIRELELRLQQADSKLAQILSEKHRDNYEACAKMAELESSRLASDEAVKDQAQHLSGVIETNNLLEKSVNELQIMNGRQDDLLKRMRDERHANEQAMKRTLCEMEQELRELQAKLSSKSSTNDERLREEINNFERELNYADQREQNLVAKMGQLRQGLSDLFPDLMHSSGAIQQQQDNLPDDWVHQYLAALRQLALTVDELRLANDANNNLSNRLDGKLEKFQHETSNKSLIGRKSPISRTNGSSYSRTSSPNSSSRPNSRATNASDHEKKLMETKLVENLALFCLRCLD